MITGNLHYGMPWPAFVIAKIKPAMTKRLLPEGGIDTGPPVKARVNHGRWVWDCECNSAELAFDEGLGMCQNCYNAGLKHKYRNIIFPKGRKQIEEALLQRPEPNRNWYFGEPVAKLKDENKQHEAELL